jgi:hypothetical protein
VPSGAPATTISAPHNYAIRSLYLGDTDRSGVPSPLAWQSFGYNLDGLVTTSTSSNACTLASAAAASVQEDGAGGIDNSFGENIVPIFAHIDSSFSQSTNASIDGGRFTLMAYVLGFDDSADNTTTAAGLTGVMLGGGDYLAVRGAAPTWSAATSWPILSTSLDCANTACPAGTDPIAAATARFPRAFQVTGEFVTGTPALISLSLSVGGQPIALNIEATAISFRPLRPGMVTQGTIAGALNTAEFVDSLQSVGGYSSSLCYGSALQSVSQQIGQASDIVLGDGGTVSNPSGLPCNAISIGLGFDATEIAVPTPSDIVEPAEGGCDCGCDGGS